jgi:hypothetical protein
VILIAPVVGGIGVTLCPNIIAGIQLSYLFPFTSTNSVQFISPFTVSSASV